MVLSNAERQERYRQRLKAAARGDDLGERARKLIEDALAVIWALDAEGLSYGYEGIAKVDSVEALKAVLVAPWFVRHNGKPAESLRQYFAAYVDDDGASPEQRETLRRAVALFDAVSLADVEPAAAPPRPKRGKSG